MTIIFSALWSASEFGLEDIGLFLAGVFVAYVIFEFIRSIL